MFIFILVALHCFLFCIAMHLFDLLFQKKYIKIKAYSAADVSWPLKVGHACAKFAVWLRNGRSIGTKLSTAQLQAGQDTLGLLYSACLPPCVPVRLIC